MACGSQLRVLQIVSSIGISHGGTATSVVGLSHALQSSGADVVVYSTDAATPARSNEHRFGLDSSDLPRNAKDVSIKVFPVRHPYRWLYAPEMAEMLRKEIQNFDLVHINGLFSYPQFAGWRAVAAANVPYVVSTHGQLDPYMRNRGRAQKILAHAVWVKRMLIHASAIHCTTEAERELIADIAPSTKRFVIPNGMHVDDFSGLADGQAFRDGFLSGTKAPLALYHGRIARKKGLDILIDAMQLVRQKHKDAILAIVGPDNEGLRSSLEERATGLGLRDSVVFTGELTGVALLEALRAADVWVLPSHTENFGLAMTEAMSAGCPVVASRAVNIAPEAHAEGAIQMVDIDSKATAVAIIHLLDNPGERKALGDRGRLFVERYDWRNVAQQYLSLYQEIRPPHMATS
ncbi:MAG: glycosyltransferase [Thermomicrobiales bacterium]